MTFGFAWENEASVGEAIPQSTTRFIEGGTFAVAEMMPELFAQYLTAFLMETGK